MGVREGFWRRGYGKARRSLPGRGWGAGNTQAGRGGPMNRTPKQTHAGKGRASLENLSERGGRKCG